MTSRFLLQLYSVKPQLRVWQRKPHARGQMAIFIALIFQVLFVLFAMAINVALVVHDKINLQSSVDLAAYYAAQRQAELLNVIGHENYMIRQSWKLLAWRYRVLGAAGNKEPFHPWRPESGPVHLETLHQHMISPQVSLDPAVCVGYSDMFLDVKPTESLCKKPITAIPKLPEITVIAGFIPANAIFAALAAKLSANFADECEKFGAINWYYASASLQAFREDQRNRKRMIYALANHLSEDDFEDLNGQSVNVGAEKTFLRNLTFGNKNNVVSFKVMNSLKGTQAQNVNQPPKWLSEININPIMMYVDPTTAAGCYSSWTTIDQLPQRPDARDLISAPLPNGFNAMDLIKWSTQGTNFLQSSDYNFSLGVEKNPWYMAYMGVSAETAPRQIFFPFGNAVRINARAFAKPFGGRVGPWYGSLWPQSSKQSTGPRIDLQVPPRADPNGISAFNDRLRLPNYSRFPGDKFGLTSQLALSSLKGFGPAPPGQVDFRVHYSNYLHVWMPIEKGWYNDPLAFDFVQPANNVAMRTMELAAITPDLFDISYYSVEPAFGVHYLPKLKQHSKALGIPDDLVIRGDLGQNDQLKNVAFSVQDQIAAATGTAVSGGASLQKGEAFYFVRDKANLLTGWTTGKYFFDYAGFPMEYFGKCDDPDDKYQKDKVPGSCFSKGGRTGYSVKLISRDALLKKTEHLIGGGQEKGFILNYPEQFGF